IGFTKLFLDSLLFADVGNGNQRVVPSVWTLNDPPTQCAQSHCNNRIRAQFVRSWNQNWEIGVEMNLTSALKSEEVWWTWPGSNRRPPACKAEQGIKSKSLFRLRLTPRFHQNDYPLVAPK